MHQVSTLFYTISQPSIHIHLKFPIPNAAPNRSTGTSQAPPLNAPDRATRAAALQQDPPARPERDQEDAAADHLSHLPAPEQEELLPA